MASAGHKALYKDEAFLWICGVQRTPGNNTLVTQSLAHREVCLLDLSERIKRGYPPIRGHGGVVLDMATLTGCRLLHTDSSFGRGILWCIEICSDERLLSISIGTYIYSHREVSCWPLMPSSQAVGHKRLT